MKKIMTAMGNETLNHELKKYAKYDVVLEDLICQDFVMGQLPKMKVDVLVMSGLLQGRWNLEEFVEKIRQKAPHMRMIIVTDEIDEATKQILNGYQVWDIFLDSSVEIQDIIEAIDREETIKKKYEMLNENVEEYVAESQNTKPLVEAKPKEASKEKWLIEKVVQKQEIIAISGTPRQW